jgi:hypothetical protein
MDHNANLTRSVIALSKLYDLADPRLSQIQVKGDLIVNQNTSGRIMTRSRARQSKPFPHAAVQISSEEPPKSPCGQQFFSSYGSQHLLNRTHKDPDQYTIVPAHLKIMKVLVEELQAASGAHQELSAADIEKFDEEGSADDGDWEDDPDNFLDLGLGGTKAGKLSLGCELSFEDHV